MNTFKTVILTRPPIGERFECSGVTALGGA